MFYSKYVLTSHGPLSVVWNAAHWEVKKQVANETHIDEKVKYIIKPAVPIALRTGGHLLIGVVRIYAKKAQVLLEDCTDAFSKIKVAFRPGAVDLPANQLTAHVNAITISDKDFDNAFDMPIVDLDSLDLRGLEANTGRGDFTLARESDITLSGADLDLDLSLKDVSGMHDMEIELGRDAMHDDSFRPKERLGNDVSLMSAKDGNISMASHIDNDMSLEEARREDSRLQMDNDDEFGLAGNDFNAKDLDMDNMDFDLDGGDNFNVDLGGEMDFQNDKDSEQEPPTSPSADHSSPLVPMAQVGNELVDAPLPQVERTQASQQQRKARRPKKKLIIDEETLIPSEVMRGYFHDASALVKPRSKPPRSMRERIQEVSSLLRIHRRIEHDDLIENTNFFKHPTTLGWCPEINELFTRTMGAGPVKGLRQLAPGEVLPEEEEDELLAQDRTLDHNVTMDSLPPMEEAAEDEEERVVKRRRTDDDIEFDIGDQGFEMDMGGQDVVPDAIEEQEEEEETDDVHVHADQYEMKGAKTQKMLKNLSANFGKRQDLWFLKHIVKDKDRLTAAGALFEILALKTRDYIEVEQAEPYADIHITKTAKFDEIGAH